MRELKFRVWGLYGDGYTYIDEENQAEAESFWDKSCIAILDEKHIVKCGTDEDGEGEGYEYCDVEEVETIEQYTGLNDKNGKEIYEGDIVELVGNIADNKCKLYRVYYRKYKARYWLMPLEDKKDIGVFDEMEMSERYKVIGNIHENPELLEDEE